MIFEADMYRLIMKSELPEAEKFADEVVEVILPKIRNTGSYSTPAAMPIEIEVTKLYDVPDTDLMDFYIRGYKIRGKVDKGRLLFMPKDACDILQIQNDRQVLQRLPKDTVCSTYSTDSIGRQRPKKMITEQWLYRLFFDSRSPLADDIKAWLADDLLPKIRKTESCSTQPMLQPVVPA